MTEKPKPRLPHQFYHPPPGPYTTSAGTIIPSPPAYDHFHFYNPNPAAGHFNPLLHPHYGRWCQFSPPGFPHYPLHAFWLFPLNSHNFYFPSQVQYAPDAGEGYWPNQKIVEVGASEELKDAGGSPLEPPVKPSRLFELRNEQSPGGHMNIALEKEKTKVGEGVIVRGPRSDNMINGGRHKMRAMGPAQPPPRLRKITRRPRKVGGLFMRIPLKCAVAQWRPKKSSHASVDPPEDCGGGAGDSGVGSGVKDGGHDASSPKTSVMIKNIPNKFRREALITFLDDICKEYHKLEFDFLYLPMDFKTRDNKGYAFLNLTNAASALKIMEHLNNFEWGSLPIKGCMESKKICEVKWAAIQGKEALVQHFRRSNFLCHTDEYLPAVFNPPRNGSTTLSVPEPIGNRGSGFGGGRSHGAPPRLHR